VTAQTDAALPDLAAEPAPAQTDPIALLRARIDALDEGIIRLVAERARLSRQVQSARIAAGGVRLELDRERRVLDSYRGGLGDGGGSIGDAVLRTCRGPL
jgi:chorismate mutase